MPPFMAPKVARQSPRPLSGWWHSRAPTGRVIGYWEFGASGAVYPFGSALSYSSLTSSSKIVAMASSADGLGYWLTAANGRVRHFGDALGHGSTTGPTKPIVDMTVTPDYGGYWELGSAGHVYPHGDAVSYGNGP